MVFAAVNALHSETEAYEWDAPGFLLVVSTAWWRIPGENGILVHNLTWAPLLLDYGALSSHDTSTFDRWTFDGDYLFRNFDRLEKTYVVQDSDEMFLISWGPMGIPPIAKQYIPLIGKLAAKAQFGASYKSAFFDKFKRRMFFCRFAGTASRSTKNGQTSNAKQCANFFAMSRHRVNRRLQALIIQRRNCGE